MDRHTLAVSQSQGNATADYPPSPCLQTPSFLSSHRHTQTVILCWIAVALYFCLRTYFRLLLYSLLCCFSKSNTSLHISAWNQPSACWFRLFLSPTVCFSSTDLGPSCVSSGVEWFHRYKYATAHKQVLGYKGLAYICTTPSFSCAAWITYCTADSSVLCWWAIGRGVTFVNNVQFWLLLAVCFYKSLI